MAGYQPEFLRQGRQPSWPGQRAERALQTPSKTIKNMERKEFLSLLGTSAAAFFAVGCLGGCGSKDSDPQPDPGAGGGGNPPAKKDFTLDLNDAANSLLKTKGNAVTRNGVVVAYTNAGSYIAVAATCTHEGGTLGYNAGNNNFVCPNHGSVFTENGAVANGPATRALKQYTTTLTGSNLRVFES
jgi:cytochrome b6-f complex iron-sulfur subunit